MKVNLDLFEMSWLLESCLRGSHLRNGTIDKFVDIWYGKLNGRERQQLYEWMLRLLYDGEFKPMPSMGGADERFIARYNPDNQYEVEAVWSGTRQMIRAFKLGKKFYVNSTRFINPKSIVRINKLSEEDVLAEGRFID